MKKTTYIIIGLLILVVVLQVVFFVVLRSTGEPWSEYVSRMDAETFDYSKNREDKSSSDENVVEVVESSVNDNFITSLGVPRGGDIEVIIKVKDSRRIVEDMDWLRALTHDSIAVNTLMLNVADGGTINVKLERDR